MELLYIFAFCSVIVAILFVIAEAVDTYRETREMVEVAKSNAWEDSYRRRRLLDSRRTIR